MYDVAVFIGRFQPFHLGHKSIIDNGLSKAKKILVLIGSANQAPNIRNPWHWLDRAKMIQMHYENTEFKNRIECAPLEDRTYNDAAWISQVQEIVAERTMSTDKICLLGHQKDGSSYYLKLFPQWDSMGFPNIPPINATDIREGYWGITHEHYEHYLSSEMISYLCSHQKSYHYKNIKEEFEFCEKYKKQWSIAPYTPIFSTVDAVVVQSGNILLVERKSFPGRGLWAMPGGFLEPNERILDGVLRELKEETRLKVPEKVLRGSLVARDVFDDPYRSSRGRTITNAFLFKLEDDVVLPKAKGRSDAKQAIWFPIASVKRAMMFEDHFDIIHNLLARI